MTTMKQVAANRRNAQRSTGPKTVAGRERSKMNAWTHGLTAEEITKDAEEAGELEAFRKDMREALAPEGALEEEYAQTVITCSWRLRRVLRLEMTTIVYHEESALGVKKFEGPLYQFLMHAKFQSLSRYEISQDRMRQRALHELQRLQALRRGDPVAAPVVVDVNHSMGFHANGVAMCLSSARS